MTPLYQPVTLFPFEPTNPAPNGLFIGPTPAGLTEIKSERVDRLPVVFAILVQMDVQGLIDAAYVPHGKHQGLSVGWLALIFLVYTLTEADHKLVSVQQWVAEHQQTLERLTGQTIRPTDFTDDGLADVLRYLSQDEVSSSLRSPAPTSSTRTSSTPCPTSRGACRWRRWPRGGRRRCGSAQ